MSEPDIFSALRSNKTNKIFKEAPKHFQQYIVLTSYNNTKPSIFYEDSLTIYNNNTTISLKTSILGPN